MGGPCDSGMGESERIDRDVAGANRAAWRGACRSEDSREGLETHKAKAPDILRSLNEVRLGRRDAPGRQPPRLYLFESLQLDGLASARLVASSSECYRSLCEEVAGVQRRPIGYREILAAL